MDRQHRYSPLAVHRFRNGWNFGGWRTVEPTMINQADLTRSAFRTLNSVVLPTVKAGIGSPFCVGAGLVVLETTGRKSGKPRQVPLVATRFGSRIDVSTVRGDSQWIKNLEADPKASVWVGGKKRKVTAEVQPGPLTVAHLTMT